MKTFNIAVIAGEGIGKEVVPKASEFWKQRIVALASKYAGTPSVGVANRTSRPEG
jgi:isocitrate/isopropylmalate dehydrogenase